MKPMVVFRAKKGVFLLFFSLALFSLLALFAHFFFRALPFPNVLYSEKLLSHSLPPLFYEEKAPLSVSAKILSSSFPPLSFSAPKEIPTPLPLPDTKVEETTLLTTAEKGYTSLDNIYINNNTDRTVDVAALLARPTAIKKSGEHPTVLIVHTHTSESYTPTAAMNYLPTDTDRTEDKNFNVVRVGEELKKVLERHGIGVIHNTEINDYPSYNGAYQKTYGVIQEELKKHPSISVVIDLHRDALTSSDGTKLKPVCEIDGQKVAQVMLVVGSDQTLEHPHWQENLSFALKYQATMCASYPDLARPINLARHRYNAQSSPGAVILEVGASGNTLEEALLGARYSGECLARLILAENKKNT